MDPRMPPSTTHKIIGFNPDPAKGIDEKGLFRMAQVVQSHVELVGYGELGLVEQIEKLTLSDEGGDGTPTEGVSPADVGPSGSNTKSDQPVTPYFRIIVKPNGVMECVQNIPITAATAAKILAPLPTPESHLINEGPSSAPNIKKRNKKKNVKTKESVNFKCEIKGCDQSFPNGTDKYHHERVCLKKPLSCTVEGCLSRFKTNKTRKGHVASVHEGKSRIRKTAASTGTASSTRQNQDP